MVRRSAAVGALALAVAGGAGGCGGAKAGAVQLTNDTGSHVTVVECPVSVHPGCADGLGRKQLGPGGTADFAPRACTGQPCQGASVVVYGYEGETRCAPVPRPDGKHSFLFLVTTLPTAGCAQYTPAGTD